MQNNFLISLNTFINIKPVSRKEQLLAFAGHNFFFRSLAAEIIRKHKSCENQVTGEQKAIIRSQVYSGSNKYVISLSDFLNQSLRNELYGLFVHGSIGTNDAIAYSDFDALVILKDECFLSEKKLITVASSLHEAKKYFFQFDPLQHHGWFVMAQCNLRNYPLTFFPPELFIYSKSLWAGKDFNSELFYSAHLHNFKQPFMMLCKGLKKTILNNKKIRNLYQLKSLLSEFMLLPAFYLQAKHNKGIYKKFSFDSAQKDFTFSEWKIMDEVSEIRKDWQQWLPSVNDLDGYSYYTRFKVKYYAPSIPGLLQNRLNTDFFTRMENLVDSAQRKIQMSSN